MAAKRSQKTTPSGSKKNSKARSSTGSANSTPSRRSATKIKSLRESPLSDDDQDSDDDDDDGSAFGEEGSESVVDEEDSEESEADQEEDDGATESESDEEEVKPKGKGKAAGQKRKGDSSEETVVKKAKTDKEEFDEDGRIVTELVQAPKTGHVPDGQISPHLMDFLSKLQIPSNNDREWFARHDAIYRYGWDNWTKFVDKLLPELIENSDETLPYLPSKDCVYRIYRDVRFSNDKTPYKTRMSATFSRGGRKSEDYGGYHIVVGPNNQSALYGGWHDPKNVYRDKIRKSIIDNDDDGKRLKEIVSEESFVEMFGEPRDSGKNKGKGKSGERQNLWGASDELKNAPKMEGVDKTHPEIEWLKLKSYWVQKNLFSSHAIISLRQVHRRRGAFRKLHSAGLRSCQSHVASSRASERLHSPTSSST